MARNNKIDTSNTINEGQVSKSHVTGTTIGDKRPMDVNPLGYGPASGTPKTKTIYNVSLPLADTEVSLTLPTLICGYMIRTRGGGILKLTHVAGQSGITYLEIPSRAVHMDEHVFENLTLYFQSPTAGETVEVVAWE